MVICPEVLSLVGRKDYRNGSFYYNEGGGYIGCYGRGKGLDLTCGVQGRLPINRQEPVPFLELVSTRQAIRGLLPDFLYLHCLHRHKSSSPVKKQNKTVGKIDIM